jgi:hypothetical protein
MRISPIKIALFYTFALCIISSNSNAQDETQHNTRSKFEQLLNEK